MKNEFTVARINRQLELYIQRLESIKGNEEDKPQPEVVHELGVVLESIQVERKMVESSMRDIHEITNYIPALDESLKFIEQALNEAGCIGFESKIEDAIFSLSYYKEH